MALELDVPLGRWLPTWRLVVLAGPLLVVNGALGQGTTKDDPGFSWCPCLACSTRVATCHSCLVALHMSVASSSGIPTFLHSVSLLAPVCGPPAGNSRSLGEGAGLGVTPGQGTYLNW